jgi:hypothetical protein
MPDPSLSWLSDLETAIVARLRDNLPNVGLIDRWPDEPGGYERLPIVNRAILLAYRGSEYDTVAHGPDRARAFLFELFFIETNLRGPDGAYEVMDTVRHFLDGWTPMPEVNPFARLTLVRDQFVDRTKTLWTFSQLYEYIFEEDTDA